MANQETRLGEICGGSVHPRDVVPPLLQELREVGGYSAIDSALRDSDLGAFVHVETFDWLGSWEAYADSEDAADDVRAILDELNAHALPHTFYGLHPDDGACYGLWPDIESASMSVRCGDTLGVSDLSEIPSDYVGEVLLVNDHGNTALYWADPDDLRCSGLCEIWSVV